MTVYCTLWCTLHTVPVLCSITSTRLGGTFKSCGMIMYAEPILSQYNYLNVKESRNWVLRKNISIIVLVFKFTKWYKFSIHRFFQPIFDLLKTERKSFLKSRNLKETYYFWKMNEKFPTQSIIISLSDSFMRRNWIIFVPNSNKNSYS